LGPALNMMVFDSRIAPRDTLHYQRTCLFVACPFMHMNKKKVHLNLHCRASL
jgi:hypothetical protein